MKHKSFYSTIITPLPGLNYFKLEDLVVAGPPRRTTYTERFIDFKMNTNKNHHAIIKLFWADVTNQCN